MVYSFMYNTQGHGIWIQSVAASAFPYIYSRDTRCIQLMVLLIEWITYMDEFLNLQTGNLVCTHMGDVESKIPIATFHLSRKSFDVPASSIM